MSHTSNIYDTAIIGGGIAGLSLAITLSKANKKVILFEKETYPFHKVCGEYISNESIPFLQTLGVDLKNQSLPQIHQIRLSSPSGVSIIRPLDIGGIGLSRHLLDQQLYQIALKHGVKIYTNTRVDDVQFEKETFSIQTNQQQHFCAHTLAGAYGKHTRLDRTTNNTIKNHNKHDIYIAVKYHISASYDPSFVELHNFKGGYCGMSAIEDGKTNLSYICKASQLKAQGSIANLEKNVLSRNPFLANYFQQAEFIFPKPLTISHIQFGIKKTIHDHILLLGDAAGNIAPLSGNGMSIAMQSALITSELILKFLSKSITRHEMESAYSARYHLTFSKRIHIAKQLNSFFGKGLLTDLGFYLLKPFPFMIDKISQQIHGDPF